MKPSTSSLDSPQPPPAALRADAPGLEVRITQAGSELLAALSAVMDAAPDLPQGPQALAKRIGIDKVLASRFLSALRSADPISMVHRVPGPEPLRRVLKGLAKQGPDAALMQRAGEAVDRFEAFIRIELGDRSALDAIISAWAPEARREFELRRKQAAFRAISQLKGVEAEGIIATALVHPSPDGEHLDIIWINGVIGLRRLRPGAGVKFATRKMAAENSGRQPRTLDGHPVDDPEHLLLKEFCSSPPPLLKADRVRDVVHYTLAGGAFGPRSAVDVFFGEVNLGELKRFVPAPAPGAGPARKRYLFAEISTPTKALHFDALVHDEVYSGGDPSLRIYDTAFEGVADVNDPAREIDRLDLLESIEPLGLGLSRCRASDVPRYSELLHLVCEKMGWDPSRFRGHRCRIDYPVYGSQVAMLFDAPVRP